jgi:HEAT repeat protein
MGSEAYEALPLLSAALTDDVAAVRSEAAVALGKWGVDAKPLVERLLKTLDDPSPEVVARAAWALGAIKALEADAVLRNLLLKERLRSKYGMPLRLNQDQRKLVCDAIGLLQQKPYPCW